MWLEMVIQENLLVPTAFLWCNSHTFNVLLGTRVDSPHRGEEGATEAHSILMSLSERLWLVRFLSPCIWGTLGCWELLPPPQFWGEFCFAFVNYNLLVYFLFSRSFVPSLFCSFFYWFHHSVFLFTLFSLKLVSLE